MDEITITEVPDDIDALAPSGDTPPGKTKKTRTRKPVGRKRDLTQPLTEIYTTLGMGLTFLNPADGILLIEHGENCAKSLNELAKTNSAVYSALDKLCTGGAMGAVMMAHAPIIMGIMANHDLMPNFGAKDDDKDSTNQPDPGSPPGGFDAPANGTVPLGIPVIVGPGL